MSKQHNKSQNAPIIVHGPNSLLSKIALPPIEALHEIPTGIVSQQKSVLVMPLEEDVVFPQVAFPLGLGSPQDFAILSQAIEQDQGFFMLTTMRPRKEDGEGILTVADLYPTGVLCRVVRILDPSSTGDKREAQPAAIVTGICRVRAEAFVPVQDHIYAAVTPIPETPPQPTKQFTALLSTLQDILSEIVQTVVEDAPDTMVETFASAEDPAVIIGFASILAELATEQKQHLLETDRLSERCKSLVKILQKELEFLQLKQTIRSRAREEMDRQQREYFLNQQLRTIQEELGADDDDDDITALKNAASKKKWKDEIADHFSRELRKLERLHPNSPDYSVQYQYIQTLLDLPWGEYTEDIFDLKHAQQVLDKHHYGLEKIKQRILDHLAVLKLRGDMKSPIICLWGPPGVGKTSLGRSIAESLGRKYVRISLGGVHDEAEIRGHRRTYIGAMPGRIIQMIKKAGASNPVVVLDEIDKVSSDYKGDPAAALLEVLDPEQNQAFHDNYIDVDYDLSNVLFVATANTLSTVAPPLLDRMELIGISGYIEEEKIEIAKRHLIPRQLAEHGLQKGSAKLSTALLRIIIDEYTRESGVRQLDKHIAAIMRKVARKVAENEVYNRQLNEKDIRTFLGPAPYSRDRLEQEQYVGVATGLAWTSVGGEILFIETSLAEGKANKLTLTGNLGDVMKESASIAFDYLRAHSQEMGIPSDIFDKKEIHIHVPEGAIPKDGPSAGITMLTSLASAFLNKPVRPRMAMTGEMTLRGRVLPVGGIKEKILAAKQAGVNTIVLSEENRKDIEEIKGLYLVGLTFKYVHNAQEVLDFAFHSIEKQLDQPRPHRRAGKAQSEQK